MPTSTENLMVRLDKQSKSLIAKAAELRRISMSDYVRIVTVPQARREVNEAENNVIALSPDEQLVFWQALQSPPVITTSQKKLAAVMRGDE